jgi:hypothetical protein
MKNALSKTRMAFTKDRIQHYATDERTCCDCSHVYYPKVHSQSYIVQFGAILVGIVVIAIFKLGAPAWLYAALPLPILIWMIAYHHKDRNAVSPKMQKVKYGEVIIECPVCGGDQPSMT